MNYLTNAYLRLKRSVYKRYYGKRGTPYAVRTLYYPGVHFLINFQEKTDRSAIIKGNERLQLEKMLTWCEKNKVDIVLDIGANFGLYSVTLARRLPTARVIAFEPGSDSRIRLAANALINAVSNLEVLPYAASATNGTSPFLCNIHGHSGISHIRDDVLLKRMKKISFELKEENWQEAIVETRTIDSLIQDSGCHIAIKIDTEGHEREVLKGMEQMLRNNECYVQVEISAKLPEHRDAVASFMRGLGYTLTEKMAVDHIYMRNEGETWSRDAGFGS